MTSQYVQCYSQVRTPPYLKNTVLSYSKLPRNTTCKLRHAGG